MTTTDQQAAQPDHEAALEARLLELEPDEDDAPEQAEEPQGEAAELAQEPGAPAEAPDDDETPEDSQDIEEPDAADLAAQGAEGEETETDDAVDSDELETARRGLRLLNAPETALQKLTPEETLAWWNSRKPAETATRAMREELNRLKANAPTTDSGAQGVPTAVVEQQAPDPDRTAVLAAIEEEFGTEGRSALEKLVAPLEAELRELRKAKQIEQQSAIERAASDARARVGERFPGLKDDARWSAVQEAALALSQRAKYSAMAEEHGRDAMFAALIEDAARAEGLREVSAEQRARQRKVDAARRSGTPNVAPHRNGKAIPKDPDARLNMMIAMVESGKSRREIEAEFGG